MKRITASVAGLLVAGMGMASGANAAEGQAGTPTLPQTPRTIVAAPVAPGGEQPAPVVRSTVTPPPSAATPDRQRLMTLFRKRAMLQHEIGECEKRLKGSNGPAELRKAVADIDAKIAGLQAQKMKLLQDAEPKLKDLYRQLEDVSTEINNVNAGVPPSAIPVPATP